MYKFSDILGQGAITAHLRQAMRHGSVSHAYILNGEKGSGRRMLAETFAAALQCTSKDEEKPCGHCASCRKADSRNHPDIITVAHRPKSSSDKQTALGVDDIRAMRSDVMIKPYSSEHKVYIVPGAESMTVQAQNALLKTLEEPPAYAVILLIADGLENFLPTVRSRCITLPVKPVPEEQIRQFLTVKHSVEKEKADMCARFARGNVGRALELAESEEFGAWKEKTISLFRNLPRTDAAGIAEAVHSIGEEGQTGLFMDFIRSWCRDVIFCAVTGQAQGLIFTEEVQYIKEAAVYLSDEAAQRITEAVDRADRRLSFRVNTEVTLEMMLLEIRNCLMERPPQQRSIGLHTVR